MLVVMLVVVLSCEGGVRLSRSSKSRVEHLCIYSMRIVFAGLQKSHATSAQTLDLTSLLSICDKGPISAM